MGLGGLLELGSGEGGEASSHAAQHLRDFQAMPSTGPDPDYKAANLCFSSSFPGLAGVIHGSLISKHFSVHL